MKINSEIICDMMESLEKYPGVLPVHIFFYGRWLLGSKDRSKGFPRYMHNLENSGLFEELYWQLYEEKRRHDRIPISDFEQLEDTIVEWVDKLQNHPEQLSDLEKEWVKINPEYKKIVINEGDD